MSHFSSLVDYFNSSAVFPLMIRGNACLESDSDILQSTDTKEFVYSVFDDLQSLKKYMKQKQPHKRIGYRIRPIIITDKRLLKRLPGENNTYITTHVISKRLKIIIIEDREQFFDIEDPFIVYNIFGLRDDKKLQQLYEDFQTLDGIEQVFGSTLARHSMAVEEGTIKEAPRYIRKLYGL